MMKTKLADELLVLIQHELSASRHSVLLDRDKIRDYIANRIEILSKLAILYSPVLAKAIEIEADNVAMKIALTVVNQADQTDARLVGILRGGLRIAAVALI